MNNGILVNRAALADDRLVDDGVLLYDRSGHNNGIGYARTFADNDIIENNGIDDGAENGGAFGNQ